MSPLPKGGCQSERIDRGIFFTQSLENTAFVHISMNNESSRHAGACHPPLGKEGFRISSIPSSLVRQTPIFRIIMHIIQLKRHPLLYAPHLLKVQILLKKKKL